MANRALEVPVAARVQRKALASAEKREREGRGFFEISAMECNIVEPMNSFGEPRLAAPGITLHWCPCSGLRQKIAVGTPSSRASDAKPWRGMGSVGGVTPFCATSSHFVPFRLIGRSGFAA